MIDFTEAAIRESALRYAVDSIDVEAQPTADEVIGRAKAFEGYLRGDAEKPQTEAYAAPKSRSAIADDHLAKCRACRSLMEMVGEPVPPWLGGRSAG